RQRGHAAGDDVDHGPAAAGARGGRMSLCRQHREILTDWSANGVPDDPSTRQVAVDIILPKLWAAFVALDQALEELARHSTPDPGRADLRARHLQAWQRDTLLPDWAIVANTASAVYLPALEAEVDRLRALVGEAPLREVGR